MDGSIAILLLLFFTVAVLGFIFWFLVFDNWVLVFRLTDTKRGKRLMIDCKNKFYVDEEGYGLKLWIRNILQWFFSNSL